MHAWCLLAAPDWWARTSAPPAGPQTGRPSYPLAPGWWSPYSASRASSPPRRAPPCPTVHASLPCSRSAALPWSCSSWSGSPDVVLLPARARRQPGGGRRVVRGRCRNASFAGEVEPNVENRQDLVAGHRATPAAAALPLAGCQCSDGVAEGSELAANLAQSQGMLSVRAGRELGDCPS